MRIAVGIKALNEAAHIDAALETVRAALDRVGGGAIVLADCGSTDGTVERAAQHSGVRIVQLADLAQRSCAVAAQMAFQSVDADYFYLLDGDMELHPDFIVSALAFLEEHPGYAAAGGGMRELNMGSIEYQLRARNDRTKGTAIIGDVDRLDGGALYRVSAIREVGHFADRNLHSYEEFELASRLRVAGWRLARIDAPAVAHHGHTTGGYRLLWRRLRSGYASGAGEVIRAAWGKPHWRWIVRGFAPLHFSIVVYLWWLAALVAAVSGRWLVLAAILLLPILFLGVRRRSLRMGVYSMAGWNVTAIGLLLGLLRRRRPVELPVPVRDLTAAPSRSPAS